MKRVVRLLAAVLCLTICLLSISLSVHAYDDVPAATVQLSGVGTPGVIEGAIPTYYTITPDNTASNPVNAVFRNFYLVRPKHNTYFSFCVRFPALYDSAYNNHAVDYSVDGLANTDDWVVVHRQFYYQTTKYIKRNIPNFGEVTDTIHVYEKSYYFCLKYIGPDISSGVATLNLKTTAKLRINGLTTPTTYARPVFFNVYSTEDVTDQINHIMSTLDMFQSDSNDFFEELTRRNLFSYTEISFDQSGNASIQEVATTWHNAVLNSLKSIVAPLAAQVEKEQQAKDYGAEDALDVAYEKSNFGALTDFFDLVDFGEYDEDVVEDAASDGPTDWFSNYTKYQLDSVDDRCYQNDGFVSFYDTNVQSILDILSGDRSERRKRGEE